MYVQVHMLSGHDQKIMSIIHVHGLPHCGQSVNINTVWGEGWSY